MYTLTNNSDKYRIVQNGDRENFGRFCKSGPICQNCTHQNVHNIKTARSQLLRKIYQAKHA